MRSSLDGLAAAAAACCGRRCQRAERSPPPTPQVAARRPCLAFLQHLCVHPAEACKIKALVTCVWEWNHLQRGQRVGAGTGACKSMIE